MSIWHTLLSLFRWGNVTLGPLPNTAQELEGLGQLLGSDEDALLLRESATQTQVTESQALPHARVVAFATHGIVAAGDYAALGEPALALTPAPDEGDGFLTRSEIEGELQLQADLVLLSACSTAAADGSLGSRGLSGLAQSFLRVGAKNVLATHWLVETTVSAQFTQAMVGSWQRGGSLAEARQAALRRVMALGDGEYAHPGYWAPFVLIGVGDETW